MVNTPMHQNLKAQCKKLACWLGELISFTHRQLAGTEGFNEAKLPNLGSSYTTMLAIVIAAPTLHNLISSSSCGPRGFCTLCGQQKKKKKKKKKHCDMAGCQRKG